MKKRQSAAGPVISLNRSSGAGRERQLDSDRPARRDGRYSPRFAGADSLRLSFPGHPIYWVVASKWSPLLEGNPGITNLIPFERHGFRQRD